MIDTVMKSTPNALPTRPSQQQEKEINHFQEEVLAKVYKQMDRSIVTGLVLDIDMEGVIYM